MQVYIWIFLASSMCASHGESSIGLPYKSCSGMDLEGLAERFPPQNLEIKGLFRAQRLHNVTCFRADTFVPGRMVHLIDDAQVCGWGDGIICFAKT